MALTSEQIAKAKAEAREFLEYSCLMVGLSLGVLPEDISSTMPIPVEESDPLYISYQTLIRQAEILESLE